MKPQLSTGTVVTILTALIVLSMCLNLCLISKSVQNNEKIDALTKEANARTDFIAEIQNDTFKRAFIALKIKNAFEEQKKNHPEKKLTLTSPTQDNVDYDINNATKRLGSGWKFLMKDENPDIEMQLK